MTGKVIELKEKLQTKLKDESKPWTAWFAKAEASTGVDRSYIFMGLVGLIGIWLIIGFAAQLLCNFIGFIYPAYCSVHAIETRRTDDDKKWLTYWVVFSMLNTVEYFLIITEYIPLYWLVKCILLVWLMSPNEMNGSIIIYNKIIRPKFLAHHGDVDSIISKAKDEAAKLLQKTD